MNVFLNTVLNTVINSLLEEGFIYGLTLFFLIYFKVTEFNRKNFRKLLIIAIPISAIVANILRLWIDINVVLIIMTLFTIIMVKITQEIKRSHLVLTCLAVLLSTTGLLIAEVYIPIYLVSTGMSEEDLKKSVWLSAYVAIPERLIEYLVLSLVYFSKIDYVEVEFTKRQKLILSALGVFGLLYYSIVERLIYTRTIVIDSHTISGLAKIILILSIPLLTAWVYSYGTYFKNRKKVILEKVSDVWNNSREYCKIR